MPTAPYAEVRASLNGGAVQTGGIVATGGESVQLSANPAGLAGATQFLWEVLDRPAGFALPAGWSLAADGFTYTYAGQTPPVFTLQSSANWGKYIVRLRLNGGGPSRTGRETAAQLEAIAALTDERTAISVPSIDGLLDVAYHEATQFGGTRGWVKDFKATLRLIQTLITGAGGGSGTNNHSALSNLLVDVHTQYLPLSGARAMLAALSLGGFKITNLATPTSGTDAATKAYVDSTSGIVTDHGALTGLNDDDHTQYELARRPLQDYTASSNDAALLDARKCITTTRSSAIALRIRTQANIAWAAETLLGGINVGTGSLTITAESGVTLNGSVTVPQHGWWWAKRTASNVWQIFTGGTGGGGGSGDVVGPATSTDAHFALFDGTTGKLLEESIHTPATLLAAADAAADAGDAAVVALIPAAGNGLTDAAGTWSVDAADSTLVVGAGGVKRAPITGDATIADGSNVSVITGLALSKLATQAALSVVTNATNGTAVPTAVALGTEHFVFLRRSNALTGALLLDANVDPSAALAWSKFATSVGNLGFTGLRGFTFNGEVDNGSSSTADTVDWTAGQVQKSTLTGNCTYTFTAPAGPCFVQLKTIQDGTGGRTVTLPVAAVSLDGIEWQPNPTANAPSFLSLYYDGTSYYYYGRSADSRIVTESTTARTFGLADVGAYVRTTNGSAINLTVPPNSTTAFPIGSLITGIQASAGQVTFVQGSGVTINKPASRNRKTAEQYSTWALKKVATDEWDLCGDLEIA